MGLLRGSPPEFTLANRLEPHVGCRVMNVLGFDTYLALAEMAAAAVRGAGRQGGAEHRRTETDSQDVAHGTRPICRGYRQQRRAGGAAAAG